MPDDPMNIVEVVDPIAPPPENLHEEGPLSQSSAIDDLPLADSHKITEDGTPKPPSDDAPARKQPEQQKEQKEPESPETPTPESATPTEKKDELKPIFETDKPLEKAFKSEDAEKVLQEPAPSNFTKKTAQFFDDAKKKWAGIIEAKDRQIHNLQKEQSLSTSDLQKENERLAKRVADLSGYETVIDYQSSEKFQKEYETPLKAAEDGLIAYMTSKGATPEGIEELKAGIKDENYLFNAMAVLDKNASPEVSARFRYEVSKLQDLRQRRNMALEDVKKNHEQFINERRSEGAKKSQQFEQGLKETITHHTQLVDEASKSPAFPFLVRMRAPEGASAELQKQVDDHNKAVESNLADIERVAKSDDPKERARMVIGYMTAVVRGQQIEQLNKKLKEANDFIERVKKAGTIPEKASGGTIPAAPKNIDMPLSEYFDTQFQR